MGDPGRAHDLSGSLLWLESFSRELKWIQTPSCEKSIKSKHFILKERMSWSLVLSQIPTFHLPNPKSWRLFLILTDPLPSSLSLNLQSFILSLQWRAIHREILSSGEICRGSLCRFLLSNHWKHLSQDHQIQGSGLRMWHYRYRWSSEWTRFRSQIEIEILWDRGTRVEKVGVIRNLNQFGRIAMIGKGLWKTPSWCWRKSKQWESLETSQELVKKMEKGEAAIAFLLSNHYPAGSLTLQVQRNFHLSSLFFIQSDLSGKEFN